MKLIRSKTKMKFKSIFFIFFLTISILLFLYTFYRSEFYYYGNNRSYYYSYYIFSISLILLSIIYFFLNEKLKTYFIIFILSTLFSLYLIEAYFTVSTSSQLKYKISSQLEKKVELYKKETGKDYDTRTLFEIYTDFKNKNVNLTVTLSPTSYPSDANSIFPFSGLSNKLTIYCNENGYFTKYMSDRYGFNNPDKEWNETEIEYILVGDSFTHGACVNRPYDIASVLRILSKKPVINLGYRGNGPLIEYAALREYLPSNVKNVLWLYYEGNDLTDLKKNELISPILIQYLTNKSFTQKLKSKQKQIDQLGSNIIKTSISKYNVSKFNKLINFVKLSKFRENLTSFSQETQTVKDIPPEFIEILKLTKELTAKNNSNLYFIYLPTYFRYDKNFDNSSYNQIKQIVNNLSIPFIDIHEKVFLKETDKLNFFPYKVHGHYTIEGYKKVTETIYNYILNNIR